jgi:uncharacterized protein (DUF302 family)
MNALETTVALTPAEAEASVREALGAQGFGVLTEIDVAAVLKAKIGVERPFLKILGACNPHFAHRALQLDPSVSLLLPCNITVETTPAGTKVAAVDPMELMDDPAFAELAAEVSGKLRAAIDAVTAAAAQHA